MDRMKSTRNTIITDDVTVVIVIVASIIAAEYLRVILRNVCTLRVILTCRKMT